MLERANPNRTLKFDMAEEYRVVRGVFQGNRNIQIDETHLDQCIYAFDDNMRDVSNGTFSWSGGGSSKISTTWRPQYLRCE